MSVTFTKDVYTNYTGPGTGTGFEATRMNNLNNTLEKVCQSINRATTYTVAANDSTTAEKQAADYVCDGTADEVQINQAIAAAAALTAAGGTVQLLGGTYVVNLTGNYSVRIKSNVALRGVGPATVIRAAANWAGIGYVVANFDAPGGNTLISIADLTVDGNKANQANPNGGILLYDCTYCTIERVVVKGAKASAITAINSDYCRILGNTVNTCDQYGIAMTSACERCVVQGNMITTCGMEPIDVDGGAGLAIIGNQVYANTATGIHLDQSVTDSLIANNVCNANTGAGINVQSSSRITVTGNVCSNNGTHGISLSTAMDCIVIGNYCFSNSQLLDATYSGIYVSTSDYNNIQGNTSRRGAGAAKQKYGIYVAAATSEYNVITNNDLHDAGSTNNILDSGTGTITAAGNRVA